MTTKLPVRAQTQSERGKYQMPDSTERLCKLTLIWSEPKATIKMADWLRYSQPFLMRAALALGSAELRASFHKASVYLQVVVTVYCQ